MGATLYAQFEVSVDRDKSILGISDLVIVEAVSARPSVAFFACRLYFDHSLFGSQEANLFVQCLLGDIALVRNVMCSR
jgi:hypothetical protein